MFKSKQHGDKNINQIKNKGK